jgi:hypothetical protein
VGTPARATEILNTVEILDGAAVETLGLGGITDAQVHGVGVADAAAESFGQEVVFDLLAAGFAAAVHVRVHLHEGTLAEIEDVIEADGEGAGFEAGGAVHGLLGDGDALDGEEFLGIGGLIEPDGAISEVGDFLDVFEAGDGVSCGGEAVFAGVLGRTGFAIGGARAGGIGGVGAIGCELLGGNGVLKVLHTILLAFRLPWGLDGV